MANDLPITEASFCSRYMDDAPGIRADCEFHLKDASCETCAHRDVRAEVIALRSALTARDDALASIRVFAQDCIENSHDRGHLGNLYSIRDLCDSKGEPK